MFRIDFNQYKRLEPKAPHNSAVLQYLREQAGSLLIWTSHTLFLFYTDKKENQIFLIFKEIQTGAVAKSYMTNGLLKYD